MNGLPTFADACRQVCRRSDLGCRHSADRRKVIITAGQGLCAGLLPTRPPCVFFLPTREMNREGCLRIYLLTLNSLVFAQVAANIFKLKGGFVGKRIEKWRLAAITTDFEASADCRHPRSERRQRVGRRRRPLEPNGPGPIERTARENHL